MTYYDHNFATEAYEIGRAHAAANRDFDDERAAGEYGARYTDGYRDGVKARLDSAEAMARENRADGWTGEYH